MTGPALAAAAAALAVVVLVHPRPPSRFDLLAPRTGRDPHRWAAPGRFLDRVLSPAGVPPTSGRRTTAALAVAVGVTPVLPPAVFAVIGWRWAWPRITAARQARARAAAVADGLPDLIDLLRLANGAGLSLPLALPIVTHRSTGPVAEALAGIERRIAAGQGRADALLSGLEPLGDAPATLGHALADHLRHGTPLEPVLDRLAFEARTSRRHRAEQAARRVPVRLLLPLVACILPAFGLLTVVPLLAGSLGTFAG